MNLPLSSHLPTARLGASLSKKVSTYKFYWLLAIIESVEEGEQLIEKRTLFSRMITNAWYTVNYFHVSFGKQDVIQQAVHDILRIEGLSIDIKKNELLAILQHSDKAETKQCLRHFNKNVPHWFLSPWIPRRVAADTDSEYKRQIYSSSQIFENDCLYALNEDSIMINPIWVSYLTNNAKILKDFCYWNLCLFLQARNPNVPDIPNKLIKPPFRSSLSNQRNNYWNIVFKELGSVDCIFTEDKLFIENFALDHFIPHAFVSHDLIWNLIPIDKSFNSVKSDKLPSMEKHFDKFFNLQKNAFEIIKYHSPKNKLLEEYLTIFPVLDRVEDFEYGRFRDNIGALVSIGGNNGFLGMK